MKTCPSCGTQYTDDNLLYCLQDGTPLTSAPDAGEPTVSLTGREEETAVRARPRPIDTGASVETAWRREERAEHAPAPVVPKRRGSTLAVASLAAALVLLVLAVAGAIGLWLYFRDPGGEVATNAANGRANENRNLQTNSNVERNTATPAPATPAANINDQNSDPQEPSPTPQTVDKDQAAGEVSQTISAWEAESERGDLNSLMGRYANSVEYYQRSGASPGFIRADKRRAFRAYDSLSFDISNVNITVTESGDAATAVFDKEWVFDGPRRSTGKVQQQLRFRRVNGEWRITSERDLRVYYTN